MKSVMNHNFGKIEAPERPRSSFDMSHGRKLTLDAGKLIPIACEEVLPGDTWNWRATFFGRLASPLKFPIMDNIFLDSFWFYVPYRILWTNWEKFCGAQDNPGDSIDFEVPHIVPTTEDTFPALGLADYFGIPVEVTFASIDFPNALPWRAYNKTYNDWFRDQDLQDSVPENTDDGPDDEADYVIQNRCKRPDYFTMCRPFAQKGDAMTIALGTSAPVIGNGTTIGFSNAEPGPVAGNLFGLATQNGTNTPFWQTGNYGQPTGTATSTGTPAGSTTVGLTTDADNSGMIADLSAVAGIPLNEIREAIAFQQIRELDARAGTRYTEQLQVVWGVHPQDSRLQRPEYLGGSSQPITISSVAQTTYQGTATIRDAKGSLAAFGTMNGSSGFMKSFPEHGVILGLVNIRADITYQQGLRRMWSRRTRFDYPHPKLAHIGEQPVLDKEIFYPNLGTGANEVFGYQEQYADQRYIPSQVVAEFRSDYGTPLDAWHLALDFPSIPPLDASFIEDAPPIDRVLAVTSQSQFILDTYHKVRRACCLPTYGTPGLTRF